MYVCMYHHRRQQPVSSCLPTRTRLSGMGSAHASHGRHHPDARGAPSPVPEQLTITAIPEEDPGPAAPRAPHPHTQRPPPRASSEQAPSRPTPPQAHDPRAGGRDVLCSPGRPTPLEEHQRNCEGDPPSVPPQPVPNLCPCQEAQGRYGAVEATQEV